MKTITFKLTVWYALIVSATVGLIFVAGRILLHRQVIEGVDLINAVELKEIKQRLGKDFSHLEAVEIERLIRGHVENDAALFYFQIHRDGAGLIFRSHNLGESLLPDNSGGPLSRTYNLPKIGGVRVSEFYLGNLHLQIASPLKLVNAFLDRYYRVSLILFLLVGFLSLFLGYFHSQMALKPVRAIQNTARRISARNLSERIPVPPGKDEFSDLAHFLNEMFDRIENAFRQIRTFTADASHELRTPLSLIRLQTEKLLGEPSLSSKHKVALRDQLEEITHLNKIIDDLLLLAKADSGVIQLERKEVSAEAFIATFSEDAAALAEDQGFQFVIRENRPGFLNIDPIWMRHVLWNLFSNALKVTPKGGRVCLESAVEANCWKVVLEDEGPGLAEEDAESIFKPFVQVKDKTGKKFNHGYGLGLAICKSIVRLHGGRIYARNREKAPGLRLIFKIPRHGV